MRLDRMRLDPMAGEATAAPKVDPTPVVPASARRRLAGLRRESRRPKAERRRS
jgi:hypothetical protein